MAWINRSFVCLFCVERIRVEKFDTLSGSVGICARCADKIRKNAAGMPYEGIGDVAYVISPFEYGGIMREAIISYKFNNNRAFAPLFAKMMESHLLSYDIWNEFDCIIPVPLHDRRLRERGYNQSELVAKYVAEYLGVPPRTDLLYRKRETKQQSSLGSAARVENVRGAFACEEYLGGKSIILFDDIYTTGNTLKACASALKAAKADKICAVTLSIHRTTGDIFDFILRG